MPLVRRPPDSAAEVRWDPGRGEPRPGCLEGADAVINLSGAGIGDRPWTREPDRRTFPLAAGSTRTLTAAMRRLDVPPKVFISQSGSGYYGDAGQAVVRRITGRRRHHGTDLR